MGLVEFAPNPSGPNHIGTLRTYAVAWKLAKEQNKKINIRFDSPSSYNVSTRNKSRYDLLNCLHELDMYPDSFMDSEPAFELANIDEDLLEIHDGYVVHDIASNELRIKSYFFNKPKDLLFRQKCYPIQLAFLPFNADPIPDIWGYNTIINTEIYKYYIAEQRRDIGPSYCDCFRFAQKQEQDTTWKISVNPLMYNNFISAKLRKVDTIVRDLGIGFVKYIYEIPAAQYFGFDVYEQQLCATVTLNDLPLHKSKWGVNDLGSKQVVGTIIWAISEFGIQKVKDDIFMSIEKDKSEIIDMKTIFGV